ncbi:MAG TPA: hypothetical protein VF950_25590 [Planctomycetota bacterium]
MESKVTVSIAALDIPGAPANPSAPFPDVDDAATPNPPDVIATFRRVVLSRFTAFGCFALGIFGCASSSGTEGVDRTDAAGDVVIRFRDEAVKTDAAIVKALGSMDDVPRAIALDARPALDTFARDVVELDARAAALSAAAGEMKSKVTAYLDRREKDAGTIVNPELRASSMDRRREVDDSMEKIDRVLLEALPPLAEQRTQMRDVLTFLANDLTPRGLAAVKDAQAKAHENGAKVRKLLIPVIERAELVALEISPARR